jgi:pimeloyl-ACP methyl ester carboxylesterase
MTLPALVLVHGGGHAGDCWNPTLGELYRQAPELIALAVDLPGRRGNPGDLRTLKLDDFVDSVVADIVGAGLSEIVLVGHSMAGIIVPAVLTKLESPPPERHRTPTRVREMVLATAFVPPEGTALADTLTGPLTWIARRRAKRGTPGSLPAVVGQFLFCNGMSNTQRRFMRNKFYPESARIIGETVSRKTMPNDVPRSWILTTRDRTLSERSQRMSIDALGGVSTVIEVDTCHNLMVSEPIRLAKILIDRCRLYENR